MLFGLSHIRIMVPAYRSSDEFYWKCGLHCELSVLWNASRKRTRITNDTDNYYWILNATPLYSPVMVINHLIRGYALSRHPALWHMIYAACDYSRHTLSLLLWGHSSCTNSDDGDMGYVVYRWGFPCLNYPINVSISWIHNLSLYN